MADGVNIYRGMPPTPPPTYPSSLGGRGGKSFRKVFPGEGVRNFYFGRGLILVSGLLKRFAPFSYLNHSFILSLNVKICIKFIVFLQISLWFFVCQELCWVRGLYISFTSSRFLFPVTGGRG